MEEYQIKFAKDILNCYETGATHASLLMPESTGREIIAASISTHYQNTLWITAGYKQEIAIKNMIKESLDLVFENIIFATKTKASTPPQSEKYIKYLDKNSLIIVSATVDEELNDYTRGYEAAGFHILKLYNYYEYWITSDNKRNCFNPLFQLRIEDAWRNPEIPIRRLKLLANVGLNCWSASTTTVKYFDKKGILRTGKVDELYGKIPNISKSKKKPFAATYLINDQYAEGKSVSDYFDSCGIPAALFQNRLSKLAQGQRYSDFLAELSGKHSNLTADHVLCHFDRPIVIRDVTEDTDEERFDAVKILAYLVSWSSVDEIKRLIKEISKRALRKIDNDSSFTIYHFKSTDLWLKKVSFREDTHTLLLVYIPKKDAIFAKKEKPKKDFD